MAVVADAEVVSQEVGEGGVQAVKGVESESEGYIFQFSSKMNNSTEIRSG